MVDYIDYMRRSRWKAYAHPKLWLKLATIWAYCKGGCYVGPESPHLTWGGELPPPAETRAYAFLRHANSPS